MKNNNKIKKQNKKQNKKLSLNKVQVNSFVTNIDKVEKQTLYGQEEEAIAVSGAWCTPLRLGRTIRRLSLFVCPRRLPPAVCTHHPKPGITCGMPIGE